LFSVATCDQTIGQTVTASQPFALWVGSIGQQVPDNLNAATAGVPSYQIPPVGDWGRAYAFARQDNRPPATGERSLIRVIASADGTTLSYAPAAPAGAPIALDSGQMGTFWSYNPFVISSQDTAHPFFLMAYMVDPCDFDDTPSAEGGAHEGSSAMSAVPPIDHWGMTYDFFMPYNYPASEIVLVRLEPIPVGV
jgi:hypothetical protein